jgi:hypothetical protein
MTNYDKDFPPLDSGYDWNHKLQTLCFNISRQTDPTLFRESFSSLLVDCDSSRLDELSELILNTRDIHNGKGEQLLSYVMLFELYRVFPEKARFILNLFVTKHGSWRDVPYLCDYISKISSRDDPFISILVNMMNDQLYKDMKCGDNNISTAAKWVPREGSKFTWLFDLLMENWTNRYTPYLFLTIKTMDQKVKARCKASANYRNVFTRLTRKLNLVETKLCNGIKFADIDPITINKKTMTKQWYSHFHMDFSRSNYPISWLVNAALKVSEEEPVIIDKINNLWANINRGNNKGFCIPIIDISLSVLKTGNIHSIIGNALLFSDTKTRILFLGNETLWYKSEKDFVSVIKDIFEFLPHFSNSDILAGFKFLLESIVSSNMKVEDIENLNLILFTDKGFSSKTHHEIESLFHNTSFNNLSSYNNREEVGKSNMKKLGIPQITYWNISNNYTQFDAGSFIKPPRFFAGHQSLFF